jgi:hypothetical protein
MGYGVSDLRGRIGQHANRPRHPPRAPQHGCDDRLWCVHRTERGAGAARLWRRIRRGRRSPTISDGRTWPAHETVRVALRAPLDFDEDGYLRSNPDVAVGSCSREARDRLHALRPARSHGGSSSQTGEVRAMIEALVIADTDASFGPARTAFRPAPRPHGVYLPLVASLGCIYVETPKVACTTINAFFRPRSSAPERRTTCPRTSMRAQRPRCFRRDMIRRVSSLRCWTRAPSVSPSCAIPTAARCPAGSTRWSPTRSSARAGTDARAGSQTARQACVTFPTAVSEQPERERDPIGQARPTCSTLTASDTRISAGSSIFVRSSLASAASHIEAKTVGRCRGRGTPPAPTERSGRHIGDCRSALIRTIYEADFRNFGYGWGTTSSRKRRRDPPAASLAAQAAP